MIEHIPFIRHLLRKRHTEPSRAERDAAQAEAARHDAAIARILAQDIPDPARRDQ